MKDNHDKRKTILAAAESMLRERRVHELTMDEVARAAGVSKGTIYRYFADKDELLFSLATDGFDQLCDVVESVPAEGDFARRLLFACERIQRFFSERRALMRMIHEHEGRIRCFSGTMRASWMEHRLKLMRAMAAVIEQGMLQEVVRRQWPAEDQAMLLLGMLRASQHAPGKRPVMPVSMVVEVFLRGVAC